MLKNTFCHIPGVGVRTEAALWAHGMMSWEDFLRDHARLRYGGKKTRNLLRHVERSVGRLDHGDPYFFGELLESSMLWRLFPDFRSSVAYLDIETTGMGGPSDYITSIALYDGVSIRWYVDGENMDAFENDVSAYDVLVSYNGRSFDVPFIRSRLRIEMPQVHIDLRYLLKSLGFGGGLKGCEKSLGIQRHELDGVDGFFAVLLWQDYKRRNNPRALETLLAYNIMDTVNLETLMVMAYNMKLKDTPFAAMHWIPEPPQRPSPFEPDPDTIDRLRRTISDFI